MKKILYMLMGIAMLASCSAKKGDSKVITVTIEPLRYFVEQIAGDKAEVVTLVPNGSSPETYEPTAQQMVAMSNSMMFVKVGDLGFERTWMKKIEGLSDNLTIVNASEGISEIESSERGVTDQHTWMSCANALVIAKNIYNSLKEKDADNASYYEQRYTTLVDEINKMNVDIASKLDSVKGSSFIIYHPALTYFAKEYGLHQLAIEEDGREPSAASLAKVIDKAENAGVKLMLVQQEFDKRNAEIVAKALDIKTVSINPLTYNWNDEMMHICNILAEQNNAQNNAE
ncbi:MAG: metal ABC transporter solute-binding protein, Zn/Mn family [Prevotella sp.]